MPNEKDWNDLLRQWPPPADTPTSSRRFPKMSQEDEDYITQLLDMIAQGKPYIVAVADNIDKIKYAMGGMSKKEQLYFMAKINLARAEKLIKSDDEQ